MSTLLTRITYANIIVGTEDDIMDRSIKAESL